MQRFDVFEPQRPLLAGLDTARGGAVERGSGFGDLGQERRHARTFGGLLRTSERRTRRRGLQRAQCQLRGSELGHCEQGRGEAVHVDASERGFGVIESPEQEQPAHGDEARLERVRAIAPRFECGRGLCQRSRRATEIAHGQCHLGFCHHTAGVRELLARAEAASGAPQQVACEGVIAELRHGDAA